MLFVSRIIGCLIILFAGLSGRAQSTANARASAVIVTDPDLSITELNTNYLTSGSKYIILTRYQSEKTDIAAYSISNLAFSVTLPNSLSLHNVSGSGTLSADLYIKHPSTGNNDLRNIFIGASFHTSASQPPGRYTTASIPVIINYN